MNKGKFAMPKPVPLNCRNLAGTGFLVTDGQQVWLLTTAHLVTGTGETPKDSDRFIGAYLQVVGTNVRLELFINGTQRFRIIYGVLQNSFLDVIAVELDAGAARRLAHFGVYDVSTISMPAVGDKVVMEGYCGLQSEVIPSTAVEAVVVTLNGLSVTFDVPSVHGISGGPVTSAGKLIGIVHGDVGKSDQMTNALALLLVKIGDDLFY